MGRILFLGFSSVFSVNLVTASPTVLASCSKSSFADRLEGATGALIAAWASLFASVAAGALGAEMSVGVIRVFLARLEGGASMVAHWPGSHGGMGIGVTLGLENDNADGLVVDVAFTLVF